MEPENLRQSSPHPVSHVSQVTGPMSHVTYQVSHVPFFVKQNNIYIYMKLDKMVKLVGGGSVNNRATPSSLTFGCFQFVFVVIVEIVQ